VRIAIIGAGVSGLVAARGLHPRHEVTVFEGEARLGGHAHTVTVDEGGVPRRLDTGFLVYNRRDYPEFHALIEELGVASQPTCMSFSVRCSRTGLEYSGSGLGGLLSQPANLLRPGFLRMVRDLFRFFRSGARIARHLPQDATVEDLVQAAGLSDDFVRWHLLPLGSALWSAPPSEFRAYPAHFVMGLLERHDLLETDLSRRVEWRTITGGSVHYVDRLAGPFRDRVRTRDPVRGVRRTPAGVRVRTQTGEEDFDQIVFACHGDDALAMLEDATAAEREILGAVRYQANDVVLHSDTSLLPRRRRARASWNYHVRHDRDLATVTYDLNRLQGIESRTRYCVTLNETDGVDPARVLRPLVYSHPQYSVDWVRLRTRQHLIQGSHRAWFCGAYFGHGFHEDGVRSANAVVRGILGGAARAA
jgi:predicted NAD/FAD-binding protein